MKAELPADDPVKSFAGQQQRDLVKTGGCDVLDDAVRLDVAEKRDLVRGCSGDRQIAAADEDIRLNTDGLSSSLTECCVGLLLSSSEPGICTISGHMDKQDVFSALFVGHLADGFKVRLALDVADRAADFGDDHVAGRLCPGCRCAP